MTSRLPHNAYTDSPKQHSNLILGSLQLLFWLVFRPSALEEHIHCLDPSLSNNTSGFKLFANRRWRERRIWRFLFQGFILLPASISLLIGIFFLNQGVSVEIVALGTFVTVSIIFLFGLCFGASRVTFGMAFFLTMFLAIVAFMVLGDLFDEKLAELVGSFAGGMTCGLGFGAEKHKEKDQLKRILFTGTALIAVGAAIGIVLSQSGFFFFVLIGGLGFLLNCWRPILMSILFIPWHFILYRLDSQKSCGATSFLSKHLAFWDEWQYLPIWGLDKHLLLVLENNPVEGQAALNYLSTSRQRWAAQAAQIELDARQLERCIETAEIGLINKTLFLGELEGPADIMFRSFSRISGDVEAAINQSSPYNQRLSLRAVNAQLDALLREFTRSNDRYAVRFRPIAQRWRKIIAVELDTLAKIAEQNQDIDSPYIIGVPLTQRQAIFVGRIEITARIEQLIRDHRRPPLLLYGQRRTGKTSLLNNLGRLLPSNIVPLFVDLQGPASSASDHIGFLYNLAKGMAKSALEQRNLTLPSLPRETLAIDPFTGFDEWLDDVEASLENKTALLALDEFEVLDQVLVEGRFSETAVLGMLRNLIQHRPRFKVLLSGSHSLEEFQRWSSYLINAQVIHLSTLGEPEARQLIEHPIEGFALRYDPDASQKVLDVTRSHPYLVQLLCAEIVALKNEQDPSIRRLATCSDVEAAIPKALSSGSMFFSDIQTNQIDPPALALLRHLATKQICVSASTLSQKFPDGLQDSLNLLQRRELIEKTTEGYQVRIELIRRWFATL